MLEHVPYWLGAALRGLRAGAERLTVMQPEIGEGLTDLGLTSPAFASGARLPIRFTADGEGVSPPLVWGEVPPGTRSLALIVEDADAPSAQPLVHAILWGLPPDERRLPEGALTPDRSGEADGRDVGRNSFFREGWLPPDPPTGHGRHDYVFQLFALAETEHPGPSPGRGALAAAMAGKVLGAGLLVGTYSRGEEDPLPPGLPAGALPA